MSATDGLRKEHEMLRGLLEALEGELEMTPTAMAALRVMCRSLKRMLNEHIQTEEDVLAPYQRRLPQALRGKLVGEHADEWLMLHELDAVFTLGQKLPTSVVVDRLARLIGDLRAHMDEEEREVFDVVDRTEQRRAEAAVPAGAGGVP